MRSFLRHRGNHEAQIVSFGAGFDTLFFRLNTTKIRMFEIDCESITMEKIALLTSHMTHLFGTTATYNAASSAFTVKLAANSSAYTAFACDLGDTIALERHLLHHGLDRSLPTLVLAECVLVGEKQKPYSLYFPYETSAVNIGLHSA